MCHAQVLRAQRRPAQVMELLDDAIVVAQQADLPIDALSQVLAGALIDAHRGQDALRVLRGAAETALRMDQPASVLALLHTAAGALALLERNTDAAQTLGAVHALEVRYGFEPGKAEPLDADEIRTRIRRALRPEEWDQALAAGRARTLEQAVAHLRRL